MKTLGWLWGAPLVIAVACGGETNDFGPAPTGGTSGGGGSAGGGTGGGSGEGSSVSGEANGATGGSSAASGGSSGSAGSSGTGIPLADAPKAYATAYCAVLDRCEGFLYDLLTAYEDCAALTEERLKQSGFDALSAAVDDGRVEYHGDRMQDCLDAMVARSCDMLTTRGIPECEAALTGTAKKGESCELNEECEGSLICETNGTCPGTCVERYSAGKPCSVDDECADGLVCSSVTQHCAEPAHDGEPCEGGVEVQCEPGFFCSGANADKMQPGACVSVDAVTLAGKGEACDPTGGVLCESDLSCVVTGIKNKVLTWECQTPAKSGGDCGVGLPEACIDGEYCPLTTVDIVAGTYTATCVPLPGAGEACAKRPLAGLMPACAPYMRCGGDKCVPFRDLGESCASDDVCYSGHCADKACEPAHACQ